MALPMPTTYAVRVWTLAALQWDAALPSGLALITVDSAGHNHITVAPGANSALHTRTLQGIDGYFTLGKSSWPS